MVLKCISTCHNLILYSKQPLLLGYCTVSAKELKIVKVTSIINVHNISVASFNSVGKKAKLGVKFGERRDLKTSGASNESGGLFVILGKYCYKRFVSYNGAMSITFLSILFHFSARTVWPNELLNY